MAKSGERKVVAIEPDSRRLRRETAGYHVEAEEGAERALTVVSSA